MNERIFPKRQFSKSFIPNILRRCFGMATTEFQECIFAYYFYRMIAAAHHVTLLYDTRTEALNSGDMSRYIYQLIHHYPKEKIKLLKAAFELPSPSTTAEISIIKDTAMMEVINAYRAKDGIRRYLSPSAINMYLSCPLKFCLHHLRGIKDGTEVTEYMDESTFGQVLHQVAEYSYNHLLGERQKVLVTSEILDKMANDTVTLERLITSAINKFYNRLPDQNSHTTQENSPSYHVKEEYINLTPLTGEARVIAEIMLLQMKLMFRIEKQRAPFTFIAAEDDFKVSVPLSPTLSINLRGIIDRVDHKDDCIEIIDYKTGSDEVNVKELEHLFVAPSTTQSHHKAILQLFLYCNAYKIAHDYAGAIKPLLLRFRKLNSEHSIPEVVINKEPLTDYRNLNNEVLAELSTRLEPLFNPDIPFTASPHPSHCKYCNYKTICGQSIS